MQFTRRALYNRLLSRFEENPALNVAAWQVRDYRSLSIEKIFVDLKNLGIEIDEESFFSYAETCETPEALSDTLTEEHPEESPVHDQVYLLIFELWRRLLPEKRSLSLFCDELDCQMELYDKGQLKNVESLQDIVATLEQILDENIDEGDEPELVFSSICEGCAGDLESFLYSFISEQIEEENLVYATELTDGFEEFVEDSKWFDLLRVRILIVSDPEDASALLHSLIHELEEDKDLEFHFELIAFLVQEGQEETFMQVVENTIPLLKTEEDFQELLILCIDYYHYLDREDEEFAIQKIYEQRPSSSLNAPFDFKDPICKALCDIIGI